LTHHRIHKALVLLQETGLGYLSLGQQSPTLSGGEAQRIKLVTELQKSKSSKASRLAAQPGIVKKALYILDEPTVGLHMSDVEKLLHVLHKLVDDGNTIVVIEHNLDVIAEADWIIDLGPEGGDKGGSIVAQGTPADIARAKGSKTGKFLKEFYKTHRAR
jgi:excinuclease ABC subunit A